MRQRVSAVRRQVVADLAADRGLRYILLLSALLSTFWLWHRVPNFATRDERWRVTDHMETVGFFLADPGIDGLREGLAHGRSYGLTAYLYALAALPMYAWAFLTGEAGIFERIPAAVGTDLWTQWQVIPDWVWTASILPARALSAAAAVACVYVIYRIGTRLRNRATGRLAALLLALTWAVVFLAHEAGEDVLALLCVLVVLYLAIEYVESGSRTVFLWACGVGGLAIALKLSAGVAAVVIGVAYLLRARRTGSVRHDTTLLLVGPALAVVVIVLSFPSTFGEPLAVVQRLGRGVASKSHGFGWLDRPSWWWLTRSTLNGLGWPLALVGVGSVASALTRLEERTLERDGVVLALVVIGVLYGVTLTWGFVRTHHLLPALAAAVLLVAVALDRLRHNRPRLARVLLASLLLTTAAYTAVGTVGYATQPRDAATTWLDQQAGPDTTVETTLYTPQEAAIPHRLTVLRPTNDTVERGDDPPVGEWMADRERRCPDFVVLHFHRGLLFLAPPEHSQQAGENANEVAAASVARLRADSGPYRVAERFGPRPPFLREEAERDATRNLLRAGVVPRSIQYGDPQDFGVDQYVEVVERTEPCAGR